MNGNNQPPPSKRAKRSKPPPFPPMDWNAFRAAVRRYRANEEKTTSIRGLTLGPVVPVPPSSPISYWKYGIGDVNYFGSDELFYRILGVRGQHRGFYHERLCDAATAARLNEALVRKGLPPRNWVVGSVLRVYRPRSLFELAVAAFKRYRKFTAGLTLWITAHAPCHPCRKVTVRCNTCKSATAFDVPHGNVREIRLDCNPVDHHIDLPCGPYVQFVANLRVVAPETPQMAAVALSVPLLWNGSALIPGEGAGPRWSDLCARKLCPGSGSAAGWP